MQKQTFELGEKVKVIIKGQEYEGTITSFNLHKGKGICYFWTLALPDKTK